MSASPDNPITGKGSEMIPDKGLPFSEVETPQTTAASVSSLSIEELIRFERERSDDFHTPEPAAARRLPPDWGLEEPQPPDPAELGAVPFEEDWRSDLETTESDPDVPSTPPIDILNLLPDFSEEVNAAITLSRRYDHVMMLINLQFTDFKESTRFGDFLRRASPYLNGPQPDLVKAEQIIGEAEYRVNLALKKKNWAASQGKRIIVYMLVWSALSAAGTAALFSPEIVSLLSEPLAAAIPGILGVSLGCLLMLRRLTSTRNTSPLQKNYLYYLQPLIGFVQGAAVYFLSKLFIQVLVSDPAGFDSRFLIYAAAFSAGFLFNFILEIYSKRQKFKT